MVKMLIDEAFSLLDVPKDADEEQIKRSHHEKSKMHHPDKQKDDDNQYQLNEARRVAAAYSRVRHSLVPLGSEELLSTLNRALDKQRASIDAEAAAQRIKRRKTRPFNRMKFAAWLIAGIAAGLALFGRDLWPLLKSTPRDQSSSASDAYLRISSFAFGLIGLVFQMIVTRIGNRIDNFMESIADRRACARELATRLGFKDVGDFSERDLSDKSSERFPLPPPWDEWMDVSSEFRRVLLKKSLELDLVELVRQDDLTNTSADKYRLRFQPSLFQPPARTAQERPERAAVSRQEARLTLVFGIFWLLALGGFTAYLALGRSSYWSILTGVLCLPGLGVLMAGRDDLATAKRRSKNT